MTSIGKTALDILYPPRCVICGRHGDFLCGACFEKLPPADGPRCPVCWLPNWSNSCPTCLESQSAFSALRSPFRYADDVRKLVHAFKYGGQSSLAPLLVAPMLESVLDGGFAAEIVAYVPMNGFRRRQRGYNQAELLARELARLLELPLSHALRRRGFAGQQAKSASAEQRRLNVAGVFHLSRPEDVLRRRVLLVDDIATTCATLDACSRALLQAGAALVLAVTLARED